MKMDFRDVDEISVQSAAGLSVPGSGTTEIEESDVNRSFQVRQNIRGRPLWVRSRLGFGRFVSVIGALGRKVRKPPRGEFPRTRTDVSRKPGSARFPFIAPG